MIVTAQKDTLEMDDKMEMGALVRYGIETALLQVSQHHYFQILMSASILTTV